MYIYHLNPGPMDMGHTPTLLAGMPSSLVGYLRVLLVWLYIPRTEKIVIMYIRGEYKKNNTSAQTTLKEALKVWMLMKL